MLQWYKSFWGKEPDLTSSLPVDLKLIHVTILCQNCPHLHVQACKPLVPAHSTIASSEKELH